MRRTLGALIAAAAILFAAAAEAASRVVLVRPPRLDVAAGEATARLEAEIRAAGFDVIVIEGAPGLDARAQVEAARIDPPAFATISIVSTARGAVADVWVADHLSDKTTVRRVDVSDAAAGEAASTLAIRAVELLRASLVELDRRGAPVVPPDVTRFINREPPAPPPRALALPAPFRSSEEPAPRASGTSTLAGSDGQRETDPVALPTLGAAVALLQSFAGLGTAVGPMIRLTHPLPLGMLVRLSVFVDVARPTLDGPHGRATVNQEQVTLHLAYAFRRGSTVRPILSADHGAHHLRAHGVADPGYVGSTHATWSFAGGAGAGLSIRLGERAALEGDVHALFLAPQPAVRIGGEEAGRAGLPVLQASLGVVISP